MQTNIRSRPAPRTGFVTQGLTKALLIENFSSKKYLYDPYKSWSGIMLADAYIQKSLIQSLYEAYAFKILLAF